MAVWINPLGVSRLSAGRPCWLLAGRPSNAAPVSEGDPVIDPNTAATGRTMVFSSVEVFDHEREEWTTWLPVDPLGDAGGDALVQGAVDAGNDDIRLVLHVSGSPGESRE